MGARSAFLRCRCASFAGRIGLEDCAVLVLVHLLRHRDGRRAKSGLLPLLLKLDLNWGTLTPHLRSDVLADVVDASCAHCCIAVLWLFDLGRRWGCPDGAAVDNGRRIESILRGVGLIRVELWARRRGHARAIPGVFLRFGRSEESVTLALRRISAVKLRAQTLIAHRQSRCGISVFACGRLPQVKLAAIPMGEQSCS